MEAMRKEIARINDVISKGCLIGKAQVGHKVIVNQRDQNSSKEGIL